MRSKEKERALAKKNWKEAELEKLLEGLRATAGEGAGLFFLVRK